MPNLHYAGSAGVCISIEDSAAGANVHIALFHIAYACCYHDASHVSIIMSVHDVLSFCRSWQPILTMACTYNWYDMLFVGGLKGYRAIYMHF